MSNLSEHWPDPLLASLKEGASENCGQSIGLTVSNRYQLQHTCALVIRKGIRASCLLVVPPVHGVLRVTRNGYVLPYFDLCEIEMFCPTSTCVR